MLPNSAAFYLKSDKPRAPKPEDQKESQKSGFFLQRSLASVLESSSKKSTYSSSAQSALSPQS